MEYIHDRLKKELSRLGLKPAAAAKAIGEPDSQGLRDVLGGRKKLSAEFLAALAGIGVDVAYVLIGIRQGNITPDEFVLIEGYRTLDAATRRRMLAFVLDGRTEGRGAENHSPLVGEMHNYGSGSNSPTIMTVGGAGHVTIIEKNRKK